MSFRSGFLFVIICMVMVVVPSFGGGDLRAGLLDEEVELSPQAGRPADDRASVASTRQTTLGSRDGKTRHKPVSLNLVVDAKAEALHTKTKHQLQKLVGSFNQGGLQDADFMVALSSLFEEERGNAALSATTRKILDYTTMVCAVLAAGGTGEMIMYNGGVGQLLGVSPYYDSNVLPYQNVVPGIVLGLAAIPDDYLTLKSAFQWLMRRPDAYTGMAEYETLSKRLLGRVAVPVGMGVLVGKTVFAYIVTNSVDMTPGITAAATIMGIPWATVLAWRAYHIMNRGMMNLALQANAMMARYRGYARLGEDGRKELRQRWTSGFRRALRSRSDAAALWDVVEAIRETVDEKTRVIEAEVKRLRSEAFKEKDEEKRAVFDKEAKDWRQQKLGWERVGDSLIVKALWDFNEGGDLVRQPKEKKGLSKLYGDHPWWYEGTRLTGIVGTGLASKSIWYGWAEVFEAMGMGYEAAYALATLVTMVYMPYIMEKTGETLTRVVSRIKGYNPVANEDGIRIASINYGWSRSVVEVISLLKSHFTAWPAALVGGNAMWLGVGPGAGHLSVAQQLPTLIPSMIAYGVLEYRESGIRLQELVTRYKAKDPKQVRATKQQKVALMYQRVDEWTANLKGEYVLELLDRLRQDPSEWFGLGAVEGNADGHLGDDLDDGVGGDDGMGVGGFDPSSLVDGEGSSSGDSSGSGEEGLGLAAPANDASAGSKGQAVKDSSKGRLKGQVNGHHHGRVGNGHAPQKGANDNALGSVLEGVVLEFSAAGERTGTDG